DVVFTSLGNAAPVAAVDTYATNEDTTLNVTAPGVLINDTDADGNPLTATLVAGPSHGTLTLNATGAFTYTPVANFNGTDTFTYTPATNYSGSDSFAYKANDGSADSNVATVTLTVTPVNDAPVAVNDSYSTNENTTLTVGAPGVLFNDTDADNDGLSVLVVN